MSQRFFRFGGYSSFGGTTVNLSEVFFMVIVDNGSSLYLFDRKKTVIQV